MRSTGEAGDVGLSGDVFEGGSLSRRGREMTVAIVVVGWLICSFLTYGLTLGGFTHSFPYMNNMQEALIFPIFGPFALFAGIGIFGFHWRLRPIPKEERWRIFHAKHNILSREYFEEHHG